MLFKVPGRIEIGGNHTDHQHGCVITATVNRYIYADAEPNGTDIINIRSEGYPDFSINVRETEPMETEKGTSAALVRGIIAGLSNTSYDIGGFDATITSEIPSGSGLSSSAAFEVLTGQIINGLFCHNELTKAKIAYAGQYAESLYYGKPCGLMDQMACSFGGLIFMDLSDYENIIVKKLKTSPTRHGYSICLVNAGNDHANLTENYAAIPEEMTKAASVFGKKFLRDVHEEEFYSCIRFVRDLAGDRAVLRAIHFFDENRRVKEQAAALNAGDMECFLRLTNESGLSSWTLLQNVTPDSSPVHQEMAFALTVCIHALKGKGAVKVHGGGFAGTILAWVPDDMLGSFTKEVCSRLDSECVSVLTLSDFSSEKP